MYEFVDLYCERLGPGLWAEPINALTNASFLIGAWFAALRARQLNAHDAPVGLLISLMCAIGIGSGLFHTFANGLTRVLDVVPILLFQLVYVWVYCRHVVLMRSGPAAGLVALYLAAALAARQFYETGNGVLIYAPAVATLLGLGVSHLAAKRTEPYSLIAAALIFVLSLGFRTVDALVCPTLPIGTHFFWHVLNGAVLYLLMRGYLASRRTGVAATP